VRDELSAFEARRLKCHQKIAVRAGLLQLPLIFRIPSRVIPEKKWTAEQDGFISIAFWFRQSFETGSQATAHQKANANDHDTPTKYSQQFK